MASSIRRLKSFPLTKTTHLRSAGRGWRPCLPCSTLFATIPVLSVKVNPLLCDRYVRRSCPLRQPARRAQPAAGKEMPEPALLNRQSNMPTPFRVKAERGVRRRPCPRVFLLQFLYGMLFHRARKTGTSFFCESTLWLRAPPRVNRSFSGPFSKGKKDAENHCPCDPWVSRGDSADFPEGCNGSC